MKKILTLVLSLIIVLSSFAFGGCEIQGEEIDITKVQLNVGYATEGFGDAFYRYLKEEYEKKNPNVQVVLNDRQTNVDGGDAGVMSVPDDLIFYSFSRPDQYMPYFMDITSMYSDKCYDDNFNYVGRGLGTVSLKERFNESGLAMLNFYEKATSLAEHKYYSVPLYNSMFGFWYDVDLFIEEDLYNTRAIGYTGLDGIKGNADDTYGPDGTPRTYDDNLPSTFEDFKKLCLYMKEMGKATRPFIWTSTEDWMLYYATEYVNMSYQGPENYAIFSTYDGEFTLTDGSKVTITPQTGYKLWTVDEDGNMPFKYGEKAALLFSEFIADNELYSDKVLISTSHTAAQTGFLDSKYTDKRAAFFIEGNQWQAEAKATFNEMEEDDPNDGLDKRKFAIMPMPKFVGTAGVPDQVFLGKNVAPTTGFGRGITALANADINRKRALVEDFLLFTLSNENLIKLAEINRVAPAAAMSVSQDEIKTMNYMVSTIIDFANETTSIPMNGRIGMGICRSLGKPSGFYSAVEAKWNSYMCYGSIIDGNTYLYVLEVMAVNSSIGNAISADRYWEGMKDWIVARGISEAENWIYDLAVGK